MASVKMAFALNENKKSIHVADVERGKKCNCVCPDCKSPLIASKGTKQQNHFKHIAKNVAKNECKGESVIHLAAKQIIIERKQITLPGYIVTASKRDSRGKEYSERELVVEDGMVICFDSVQEEIDLHGMKVDILAKKDNRLLIIEIFYCHKVEDQKLGKIAEANISAIEIDLSDLNPEEVKNWETLWLYINDPKRIRWLHNARARDHYPVLQDRLAIKINEQEKKYKQEEIGELERAKKDLLPFHHHLKEPHRKEYTNPNNQTHVLSRPFAQRRPIELVCQLCRIIFKKFWL